MSIQIKRGMKKDLPQLKDGELAFCRDTKELYVGNNGNENVSVTKKVEDRLDAVDSQLEHNTSELTKKANVNTVISNLYNTEGIISEILNICQTYTDNFDKFKYGNIYTAWDDRVQTVNGKFELDCSSFINLLIHGVSFYNSRYNGKYENISSPLFFNKIDSYKYRLANQIAKYCVENGYAFVPKSLDEIRAGDIVFYSWKDFETNPSKYTQAQIDFHNNAFMKIDHVAMYLDRKNESFHQTIQYEQYTPQFLYNVSEEYMNQTVLVARLPFANVVQKESGNLIVNGNKKQSTPSGSMTVGTYYLNKKLEKGKIYSLAINGLIETEGCYIVIQDGNNSQTIQSDYGRQKKLNGTQLFYFLYQGEGTDVLKISLGGDSSISNRVGHINWAVLNEGYKIVLYKPQSVSVYNKRKIPLTDWIKQRIQTGYAESYDMVETETHYIINLNLPVNEDFSSTEIQIGNLGTSISNTIRIPCNLISYNNTSSNGVLQFKWNGEISIIKYDSTATWRHAIASGIVIK